MSLPIDPAFQCRGYAGEFLEGAFRWARANGLGPRIIGLARPANAASRRVLEKAGFRSEGPVPLCGAPTERFAREIA